MCIIVVLYGVIVCILYTVCDWMDKDETYKHINIIIMRVYHKKKWDVTHSLTPSFDELSPPKK